MLGVFLLTSFGLHLAWTHCSGTPLERLVINTATVRTAVALINFFTPQVAAVAVGTHISADGGGINVLNGCEGTELYIPLLAGLIALPFSMGARVVGIFAGAAVVFGLNQMRLLALFYSLRADPVLFGELHGIVTPLVLVACVLSFFLLLLRRDALRSGATLLGAKSQRQ